jgi:NAD(P)-dependent dehydrogenase (short-subunit alcohol dehydrogenase family)
VPCSSNTHSRRCNSRFICLHCGKDNITVKCVAPTFIWTPGTNDALADLAFSADGIGCIAGLHLIGEPMAVAGAFVVRASPS